MQRAVSLPNPPPKDASSLIKMAYKLKTALGKAIYGGTQMHRRTGDRHYQGGVRLPPVLLARGTGGGWRVVSGLFGVQSQALPYLILGITRERQHASSPNGASSPTVFCLRPCSVESPHLCCNRHALL